MKHCWANDSTVNNEKIKTVFRHLGYNWTELDISQPNHERDLPFYHKSGFDIYGKLDKTPFAFTFNQETMEIISFSIENQTSETVVNNFDSAISQAEKYFKTFWNNIDFSDYKLIWHVSPSDCGTEKKWRFKWKRCINGYVSSDGINMDLSADGKIAFCSNYDTYSLWSTCVKKSVEEASKIACEYAENDIIKKKKGSYQLEVIDNANKYITISPELMDVDLSRPVAVHPNYIFSNSLKNLLYKFLNNELVLSDGTKDLRLAWIINLKVIPHNVDSDDIQYMQIYIDTETGKILGGKI
ncbi:MAG: hypothetical protein PHW04_08845 [Candidatus Wallbacteria bacterium]|nr:hypothetical protein [Candidatus Wallbacteria bacterium]